MSSLTIISSMPTASSSSSSIVLRSSKRSFSSCGPRCCLQVRRAWEKDRSSRNAAIEATLDKGKANENGRPSFSSADAEISRNRAATNPNEYSGDCLMKQLSWKHFQKCREASQTDPFWTNCSDHLTRNIFSWTPQETVQILSALCDQKHVEGRVDTARKMLYKLGPNVVPNLPASDLVRVCSVFEILRIREHAWDDLDIFKQVTPYLIQKARDLTPDHIKILSGVFHRLRFQNQELFEVLGDHLLKSMGKKPFTQAIMAYLQCCAKVNIAGNEKTQLKLAKKVRIFKNDALWQSFMLQFYSKLEEEDRGEFVVYLRDIRNNLRDLQNSLQKGENSDKKMESIHPVVLGQLFFPLCVKPEKHKELKNEILELMLERLENQISNSMKLGRPAVRRPTVRFPIHTIQQLQAYDLAIQIERPAMYFKFNRLFKDLIPSITGSTTSSNSSRDSQNVEGKDVDEDEHRPLFWNKNKLHREKLTNRSSMFHYQVSLTLKELGLDHELEVGIDPYTADIQLLLDGDNTKLIEIDGPMHFRTKVIQEEITRIEEEMETGMIERIEEDKEDMATTADDETPRMVREEGDVFVNPEEVQAFTNETTKIESQITSTDSRDNTCTLEHVGSFRATQRKDGLQEIPEEAVIPQKRLIATPKYNVQSILKHRLLTKLGFKVYHIPYFQWPKTRQDRFRYLQNLLSQPPPYDEDLFIVDENFLRELLDPTRDRFRPDPLKLELSELDRKDLEEFEMTT